MTSFPAAFDNYYMDHFGLRKELTGMYSWLKFRLGDSPSKQVTIGKDGWLFLGPDHPSDPIGDVRNVNLYSDDELKQMTDHLEGLSAWLNELGIAFLFVIAPIKHTVYFEKLPDYITRVNENSATDQLADYLSEHTEVSVVDLRSALINNKKDRLLYYRTGTHWNFRGCNIAQFEILKAVEKKFPGEIAPELYDDSIFRDREATDRGLELLAGIQDFMQPPLAPYPVFEPGTEPVLEYPGNRKFYMSINPEQKLEALVFRDSFFKCLVPFFDRKFGNITYTWQETSYSILAEYLKTAKPDIIIEEIVERRLPRAPQVHRELAKALERKRKADAVRNRAVTNEPPQATSVPEARDQPVVR